MDADDIPIKRLCANASFETVLSQRMRRRTLLKSLCWGMSGGLYASKASSKAVGAVSFQEISHGMDEHLHLAEGYASEVLLRWGDAMFPDAPVFNPHQQRAKSQLKQFGYNNDFLAYLPLTDTAGTSSHGVLAVNHEYVSSALMHPGSPKSTSLSRQQVATEMAAHGLSIVEIKKQAGKWQLNINSTLNRRITPFTSMRLSGPACGHARVKTSYSQQGEKCLGTFGNCAGSITPWGTILTAEENIQAYFSGSAKNSSEKENYKRFGLYGDKSAWSIWGKYYEHWNLDKHPQAAMHAGWVVEIDPYAPSFMPIKRTALGRCKHEGCGTHLNKDGRVVVYMGDDQAFEYIYRFVSKQKYISGNRKHNLSLLDEGELAVAEFTAQGKVIWHPLQYGIGPHTEANGFSSQADVVLDMRKAADLVGATPMDRPEEVKVNPISGNVFAMLTNNARRNPLQTNAANPRAVNRHGHILELSPPGQDHTASEYQWEIFILAGDPNNKIDKAYYHHQLSEHGWFSSPDNCSFDEQGNIWIATDGFNRAGKADGIWISATTGNEKALSKQFLRAPIGAEICSPCFTPDFTTMFCSVQHPGSGSTFDSPSTRWPDFDNQLPPRPSIVAIQREDGEQLLNLRT